MHISLISILLIIALTSGQLLKLPLFANSGPTLLDFTIGILTVFGLTKLKLKKPTLSLTLGIIFVIICLLSLVLTPLTLDPHESLISLTYTIRFGLYLTFGWLIYSNTFKNLDLPKAYQVSGLIVALLGLLQLIFLPNLKFLEPYGWDPHYYRTVSTFLDPNFLGAFLTISFILNLNDKQKNKNLKIVILTVLYIAIITTFSRSVLLMFATSLILFSLLNKSKQLLLTSLILSFLFVTSIYIYNQALAAPQKIDRVQSAAYRLSSYQQGKELFLAHPVLGVGYNNYRFALAQYHLQNNEGILFGRATEGNDSSLLQVLATTGIIGFVIFIAFLALLIWNPTKKILKFKELTPEEKITTSLFCALLIHSLFLNSLFYPPILLWLLGNQEKDSTQI